MMIFQRTQLLSEAVNHSSNNIYPCMVLDKYISSSGLNLLTNLNLDDSVLVNNRMTLNGTSIRKTIRHAMDNTVNLTPNRGYVY